MLLYLTMIEDPEEQRKFERIYRKYHQIMLYAANRILHDEYESEDAVHQAFIKIIQYLNKINEEDVSKTRAYLVVIVERTAIDIYRRNKRSVPIDDFELYRDVHAEEFTGTISPFAIAFAGLSVDDSNLLSMKYSMGYRDEEIAQMLHIKIAAVRKRVMRAKHRLAARMEKEGMRIDHVE